MNSNPPFDLVIGLDRSDRKADLYLIDVPTGKTQKQTLDTSPEALHDWLAKRRQEHPQAQIGLCLEQPATNLILFLEAYSWITLYAINPITLQKFREAFVTSRAKDDGKDAQYLAELLLAHHSKHKPWQTDDSQTRQLLQLTYHRRSVIDQRTGHLPNWLEILSAGPLPGRLKHSFEITIRWYLGFCRRGRSEVHGQSARDSSPGPPRRNNRSFGSWRCWD